jgi:spermidine/putrescine transport system substrate-binding protein
MSRLFVLLLVLLALPARAAEVLTIYNWSEYLPEKVIALFTQKTGIQVKYVTYESNEEMYANVKAHPGEYDLVVPSTYYISKMRQEGLLQKLDKASLENIGNLDQRLLNQSYDPNNEYSLPYLWGTTTLFVDTSQVKTPVTSWSDLWRPEFRGKLLMLDDMREVFHVGLVAAGYSGNSTNPKEIEAAYKKLVELKPNIMAFDSESPKDAIAEKHPAAGMIWNGDIFQARQDRHTIEGVYPKEGAVLWIDSMAIPAGARHAAAAQQFMDFVMKPGMATLIAESYGYATPNRAAMKTLDLWMRGSSLVYPSDEVLKKAHIHVDLGANTTAVYEKYWKMLREAK